MDKYLFDNEWIQSLENKYLWMLYYYQQKLLLNQINVHERIAEVGVGSKFTYNYLKSKGYKVESIDIDANKKPDKIINIVDCDISELKYDVILAFNIFEHIPYNEFILVINKLHNAGVKKIFLGLPYNKKIVFELYLHIGRFLNIHKAVLFKKNKITAKNHQWEIDYQEYSFDKITEDLVECGYQLKNHFNYKTNSFFHLVIKD